MAYVYRHIRLDTNQPFYIGIGSDKNYFRANQKSSSKRNNYWFNIVSKTDYEVEIMLDDLTWQEACEKEKEFIALYGRKDNNTGILSNMTDGGEGVLNVIVSDITRAKLSKLGKKRMGIALTEEHKKNISLAKKRSKIVPPSRKGAKMSADAVKRIINTRKKNGIGRKKIYQYDLEKNLINIFTHGDNVLETYPKFSKGNINMVCRGERKLAYNFIWSYTKL